jgi:hypothetical protein
MFSPVPSFFTHDPPGAGMAIGTRMGTFFLPFNFFAEAFAFAAPYMPDWKNHNQHR